MIEIQIKSKVKNNEKPKLNIRIKMKIIKFRLIRKHGKSMTQANH